MSKNSRELFLSGASEDSNAESPDQDRGPADKEEVLSVSEVTRRIKAVIEKKLGHVWVQGEISNLSQPSSGHVYFDVKDEDTVLPVVLFRRYARKVNFELDDGQEIRVYGLISAYEKRGNYQMIARDVKPVGEGALLLAFQKLCDKLEEEGLFEDQHKKSIPSIPRHIGIVTSPTGAAIRDMIRTIRNRDPLVDIQIYPARVQGEEAAEEIARGVEVLNTRNEVEVIIVSRGGGSLEDLWAFNEEVLGRAIFASDIPVVSAVGHEVDVTISDLVADQRVATPTSAGQFVVPDVQKLLRDLRQRYERMNRTISNLLHTGQNQLQMSHRRLQSLHPRKQLKQKRTLLRERGTSLLHHMKNQLETARSRWESTGEKLEALSPLSVLERGYSITRKSSGEVVKQVDQLQHGEAIQVRLQDGSFQGEVTSIDPPQDGE